MAYTPMKQGSAERRRFIELPQTYVPTLTGMEEPTNPTSNEDGDTRRYAQLVVGVGGEVEISGDNVNLYTLEDIYRQRRTVELAGIVEPAFATVIEEEGNFMWVAEAEAGTALSSTSWRIKEINTITQGSIDITEIKWVDDNGNFDNAVVSPLSGLF
tara:strand:- start:453 stop:923 length:471 start_codon:yes stop_codon:yes gene_type:complete